jgi:poly(3-hydroxybutyrate) depolymerase
MAADKHRSYVQEGVGHYGIFAGSRWSREVYPVIRDFIRSNTTADEVDTDAG